MHGSINISFQDISRKSVMDPFISVIFNIKNCDTLEIAEHSLISPIVIPRYGFHFRSTDLVDKPHS